MSLTHHHLQKYYNMQVDHVPRSLLVPGHFHPLELKITLLQEK